MSPPPESSLWSSRRQLRRLAVGSLMPVADSWSANGAAPGGESHQQRRGCGGREGDAASLNGGPALDGSGEIVGICDTGLDVGSTSPAHPDFAGRVKWVKSYPITPTSPRTSIIPERTMALPT
jgi:hypothetical protein